MKKGAPKCVLEGRLVTKLLPECQALVIPVDDVRFGQELSGLSTSTCRRAEWVAKDLVFKTIIEDKASLARFCAVVNSLAMSRFFFIAPIQGFTASEPYGVFYDFYPNSEKLSACVESLPNLSKTLISAFVCYGMTYLETTGTIHGSLHSGNILIDGKRRPIITDAGLGRQYDLFTGDRKDAVSWIAPEILLGSHANYNSDVYSFGVMLYEISEGYRPHHTLTNRAYLSSLRSGTLEPLKFVKTNETMKKVILECMKRNPDERPSFAELYSLFYKRVLYFENGDENEIDQVLAMYPLRIALWPEVIKPTAVPAPVVGDCAAPQDDHLKKLLDTVDAVDINGIGNMCEFLKGHVMKGRTNEQHATRVLAAICRAGEKSPGHLKELVKTKFLSCIHIESRVQADAVLPLVKEVLSADISLLASELLRFVSVMFIWKPREMLSAFALYISKQNVPVTVQKMGFFLGLAPVFAPSKQSSRYCQILFYMMKKDNAVARTLDRDILKVVRALLCSPDRKAVALVGPYLSSRLMMDFSVISSAIEWQALAPWIVRLSSIPVQKECVRFMLEQARSSIDGFALVMKYVTLSQEHGMLLLEDCQWMTEELPTYEHTFRLMLAIFAYVGLRPIIAERNECFGLMKAVCLPDESRLHAILSIFTRMTSPLTPAIVKRAFDAGLFRCYEQVARQANNILCIDAYILLMHYVSVTTHTTDLAHTTQVIVDLARSNSVWYNQLSPRILPFFAQASHYSDCAAVLKNAGLADYFRNLLQLEGYAPYAQQVLDNMAK